MNVSPMTAFAALHTHCNGKKKPWKSFAQASGASDRWRLQLLLSLLEFTKCHQLWNQARKMSFLGDLSWHSSAGEDRSGLSLIPACLISLINSLLKGRFPQEEVFELRAEGTAPHSAEWFYKTP